MLRALRSERGFTLIELMIVVAIVAIIATIGFALYQNIQGQARLAADRASVAALRSAVSIYYAANAGAFPASLGTVNALVAPAPTWQCGIQPTYDSAAGTITLSATTADCL